MKPTEYVRPAADELVRRLAEPRRFILALVGPRQVGKTTLLHQAATRSKLTMHYASADEPTLRAPNWVGQHWEAARRLAKDSGSEGVILALDEVQKLESWSAAVKRFWDEDTRSRTPVKVVLLGSAPLLVARGLSESLAGRFELVHLPHWSFGEMRDAFDWTLDDFLLFGGYPGAAPLIRDPRRWSRYVADSLIETTISRDVLLLSRVDKPALLRRLFELGCRYSGQILSFTKMLGQLQEAGNTTTLAHYLELLAGAGMITGLQKFAGKTIRQRGSSPKLQVLNTALMTASLGLSPHEIRSDHELWGRLAESAAGAHLANAAASGTCELFYWRDHDREIDFVARAGRAVTAIEVKSGRSRDAFAGFDAFAAAFKHVKPLLVGGDGVPLEEFLARPASEWVGR